MASDQQPDAQEEGVHPRDMSPYIRTYAKDVAKLTGQLAPAAVQAKKDDTDTPSVSLPEVDPSPRQYADGPASPKEFPQEVLEVSKKDAEEISTMGEPPMPAPTPAFRPREETPVEAPAPMASIDEERQAILERLRKKIAAEQQVTAAPPMPLQPEPIPTAPMMPPLAPAATPPTEASPLHTYTSDFADQIDKKQASTFSVLAAQQDSQKAPASVPARRSSAVPIMLAVVLILLGTGGLGAAFYLTNRNAAPQETLGVPSLIFADEKIELTGPDYRRALADAGAQPLVEGNVLITYVTSATTTERGIRKDPQPGGVLLRLLELGAPDILLRNVDISSTVGVIAAGGETRPFFLMRVNSFERTFAGMLGWESRVLQDLALFYPPYADLTPIPSLETATSTPATSTPPTLLRPASAQFSDDIVANRDVRVLRDGFGRSLMLYGYADKQTLIIARDEAAFAALVARLTATVGQ